MAVGNDTQWSREVSECLGSINMNLENVNRQLNDIQKKLDKHDEEIAKMKRERSYFLGAGAAFGTVLSFAGWAFVTVFGG